MSSIKAEWLRHGRLKLGEKSSPSTSLNARLSAIYSGVAFKVRHWPGRLKFKHTLYWSEKDVPPRVAAAYMLKLDPFRGPALYVGINVEKGYEDEDDALRRARETKEPIDQLLMSKDWDWHKALNSFPRVGNAILDAAGVLGGSLYCWVEFGRNDHEYFFVTSDAVYQRVGFKPVDWNSVVEFARKPRPLKMGRLSIMRAFSLDECTPAIDESRLWEVFHALRNVRDMWHGIENTSGPELPNTSSQRRFSL